MSLAIAAFMVNLHPGQHSSSTSTLASAGKATTYPARCGLAGKSSYLVEKTKEGRVFDNHGSVLYDVAKIGDWEASNMLVTETLTASRHSK